MATSSFDSKKSSEIRLLENELNKLNKMTKYFDKIDPNVKKLIFNKQIKLGILYRDQEKDFIKAAEWFRKAADKGSDEAQVELGLMFLKGKVIPKDAKETVDWVGKVSEQKIAEQGNFKGLLILAEIYEQGRAGVPKDEKKAEQYLCMAGEIGPPNFQYRLGVKYENGVGGIPKNKDVAFKWYRKSLAQGYPPAVLRMIKYENGGRDAEEEVKFKIWLEWHEAKANEGSINDHFDLGYIYGTGVPGVPKNLEKSFHHYNQAAEQIPSARYKVGCMYENGQGVPKSLEKAFNCYELAAKQGSIPAQKKLGNMYENGQGVPQNLETAFNYYLQAAEQGDGDFQRKVAGMYATGQGIPKNERAAEMWNRKADKFYSAIASYNGRFLAPKTSEPADALPASFFKKEGFIL